MDKLKIHAFKKQNFTEKIDEMSLPINPESFTKNIRIDLDERRGHGNNGTNPDYKSTIPEELRLEFMLDGTQTMEGYVEELKDLPVHDQLVKLLNLVSYNGDIHRPNFLLLIWGSEIKFQCVLSTLDINYTLFNPKGEPLRAKLTANFVNYKPGEERLAQDRNSSPDLTHYRKVKAGDRLDLMSFKIYNHSKYYLQVAQKNNLSHVRNIKPGIELYFPPFDKTEA